MPIPAGEVARLLASAAELAVHLKQPVKTAAAEQALVTASAFVEGATGMAFTIRSVTLILPAPRGQFLYLPVRPVRGVTSVVSSGTMLTGYTLDAGLGLLYRYTGWSTALYTPLEVTMQYGAAAVPDDVKGVVLEVAGQIYDEVLGKQSEGIDDYRVSFTGELSAMSRMTLSNYGGQAAMIAH